MSTSAVVSDVTAAVSGAASGPMSLITALSTLAKPLLDLIPDPQAKLQAQQHIADQQFALAQLQIQQQNQIIEQAGTNARADTSVAKVRAYFCFGVTSALLINMLVFPLLHAFFHLDIGQIAIPFQMMSIFAVIMLGFVGIPQGIDLAKDIAAMPGDSQVSLLGGAVKLGNNSPKG